MGERLNGIQEVMGSTPTVSRVKRSEIPLKARGSGLFSYPEKCPRTGFQPQTARETASAAEDTDFFMKSVDVCPGGNCYNVLTGGCRGRYLKNGITDPVPLTLGEINAYPFELHAMSCVLRKGHQIRVEVCSPDAQDKAEMRQYNSKGRSRRKHMQIKTRAMFSEIVILSAATAIIAAAVFFFLVPSHTAVSSISGLAIVLQNFVPLPVSAITMILNVALLIAGFLTCGREFGAKTVYTSILLPLFLALFENLFPDHVSMTGSDVLDVVCYIFTVSIGLAILFNRNASSGGLDIAAKIVNKYTHMELGRAMSLCGMLTALSSALVFDKRTVVLSVLGTYVNGLILDHFIFGQNIKRRVCIVSLDHMEEIRQYILCTIGSGASLYEATGAYTMERHTEIITIVDKHEYQMLMDYLLKTDPAAFVTVYNVSSMRYRIKTKAGQGTDISGRG